jgi:hypothetical protein
MRHPKIINLKSEKDSHAETDNLEIEEIESFREKRGLRMKSERAI